MILKIAKGIWRKKSLLRTLMNLELANYSVRGKVLDIGGGVNPSYFEFLKKEEGAEIINIDFKSLHEIGKTIDLEKDPLPYSDGSIDHVLVFNLFEHIYNYRFLAGEIKRVLNPGRQVLGFVPFMMSYHPDPRDYFRYTTEALRNIFGETVFESHRWPQSKIWLHKYFIKKAVKVIAVTNTLAELYKKCRLPAGRQGFKESDILVARDGVDLKIFDINISKEDARAKLGLPQNAVLLGYTGATHTMGMGKGLEDMTEAVAEILKSRQNVFLVSVGGNKTYTEGNNLFIERVPRAKLALYQKAFDVLLMPFPKTTHYSYYMSPMKMFEYMASKRPIVASNLPS